MIFDFRQSSIFLWTVEISQANNKSSKMVWEIRFHDERCNSYTVNCSNYIINKKWKEISKLLCTIVITRWIVIREISHKLLNFIYSEIFFFRNVTILTSETLISPYFLTIFISLQFKIYSRNLCLYLFEILAHANKHFI